MWRGADLLVHTPPLLAHLGMDKTEQGGLLLGKEGTLWAERLTLPGPLDLRTPSLFMLLDPHHQSALDVGDMSYLGFWHSHPPGTPSEYSPEDWHSWRRIADDMFPQLPTQTHLLFPIVTGDRLRAWAMARDLTLTELEVV